METYLTLNELEIFNTQCEMGLLVYSFKQRIRFKRKSSSEEMINIVKVPNLSNTLNPISWEKQMGILSNAFHAYANMLLLYIIHAYFGTQMRLFTSSFVIQFWILFYCRKCSTLSANNVEINFSLF